MTTYTDVFGTDTIPPSGLGYETVALSADTTFSWPYNATGNTTAKIMDVTSGSAGLSMIMPDATQVSTGEDLLIRNVGSYAFYVKNSVSGMLSTVNPGAAVYLYITNNSTAAGVWGSVAFGVGTSSVDAATLIGYGIKAIGSSLNQSHPTLPTASGITIDSTHRAKLVVFTGGASTFSLTSAATLGDDYFCLIRNDGTGTLTIDPASAETVDGLTTLQIQPSESLMLICTGASWYTVGYGRSVVYQFTQLTKDVSAGGSITLTAAEASNKLITFIGNPAGAVTVIAPSVAAVYYTYSNISTAQTITFKTAAGSGVGIGQGARIIAMCDGTNMVSAQSAVANSSVSLTDGTVSNPSLYFSTQTNTGLYKYGTNGLGVAVAGADVGRFTSTGLNNSPIGASTPASGAFTTLSASSTVSGVGFSTYLASPPAIGGTAPAAGAFTTLSASSTVSGAGFTSLFSSPPAIGGTAPAAGTFTTLSATSDLSMTGSGKRITGDFSNATIANRVMFQTSTVNGFSFVSSIPNGTHLQSGFIAFNNSNPTNAAYLGAYANGTGAILDSGITGSGSYLPLTFYTGGLERMRIDTSGNVAVGTVTNTYANRISVFTSATNPASSGANGAGLNLGYDNFVEKAWVQANRTNSTEPRDLTLQPNGGNTLHSGSGGGLGYGTGSGGTVTQALSKNTSVTLNKPTGQITMNNAALAANTAVAFTVNCSLFAVSDNVVLQLAGGTSSGQTYNIWPHTLGAGQFEIVVKNISAGSLSENVQIQYSIIKGATA